MFNCLSAVSFNNSTCYYPNNSYLFQHVLKFRVPNPKTILLYTIILRFHSITLIIIQIIHIYFNTCSKFEYRTLKPYSYILYIFYIIIQEYTYYYSNYPYNTCSKFKYRTLKPYSILYTILHL